MLPTAYEAAALAKSDGNVHKQAVALNRAAWSALRLDRYDEAVATAREAAALAERAGDVLEQTFGLRSAAFSLNRLGRYDEALTAARRAAALAERAGDVREQALALENAAFTLGQLRLHEEALAAAREAAVFAERIGNVGVHADALRRAAVILRDLGRHEEGATTAREAAVLAERAGDIDLPPLIAGIFLSFRTPTGLDHALTSYELLIDPDKLSDYEYADLWFQDFAHIVTATTSWPRLIRLLERSPNAAKRIGKDSAGLGEAGDVIATAHAANQRDTALSQARHLVAALAQVIEAATNQASVRLWEAVLNASAETIATKVHDGAFLREFAGLVGPYGGSRSCQESHFRHCRLP